MLYQGAIKALLRPHPPPPPPPPAPLAHTQGYMGAFASVVARKLLGGEDTDKAKSTKSGHSSKHRHTGAAERYSEHKHASDTDSDASSSS